MQLADPVVGGPLFGSSQMSRLLNVSLIKAGIQNYALLTSLLSHWQSIPQSKDIWNGGTRN